MFRGHAFLKLFVFFLFSYGFCLLRFFLHFSRSTPKGPPPRRRFLTFFYFPWIYLFVVLFFFLFVVFCITQTPARPSREHPKIPQDSPRPPQDHLNTPQDHPKLAKEHFKISQDAPRAAQGEGGDAAQSTPYYTPAQVTRGRIPTPPPKTSILSLRTPQH